MQLLKVFLVRLGPDNYLTRLALQIAGILRRFKISFSSDQVVIAKCGQKMILPKSQYVQVPMMMDLYDLYFDTIASERVGEKDTLDFSKPAVHRYKKTNVEFWFPSIPEDDVIDIYTAYYKPQPGDVVWDVGAHAGATTYFLSQMVGPTGRVYAFEPDEQNFEYLLKNIEHHKLVNVTPVKKALAPRSGYAEFCMDGTMGAGLTEYLTYSDKHHYRTVPTVSFADACNEVGCIPQFVKLDIEGAEIDVIQAAGEILQDNSIHFAIESEVIIEGEPMWKILDRLFPTFGYKTWSAKLSEIMFTWASPPPPHG